MESDRAWRAWAAAGLLAAHGTAWATPGDQLYLEDFENGVPTGWTKTVGDPTRPTFGVNDAFGYNAAYVAGEEEVRVETPAVDLSGVPGARVAVKVIRGDNVVVNGNVQSNRPDTGENFELEFWGNDNAWHVVVSHSGGDPPGEVFNDVIDLPAEALHAGFRLRFGTYGGDPWDGSPDDFWHFDDVTVIETSTAGGNLGDCTLGADFDSSANGFSLNGSASLSSLTYTSAGRSLRLPSNGSNAVSPVVDLAGKTATISAWVRAGGWQGGPDKPESVDHLQFEYLDSSNEWQSFQVFCNLCSASGSIAIDPGGVYSYSANLPTAALHSGFRLRLVNTSTHNSTTLDNWFVDNLCITATSQAHHFAIAHDGGGVNCQAEPVLITAHASDHSVAKDYSGTISLGASTAHGDWSAAVATGTLTNSGNGAGSYAFGTADEGSVTLLLKNTFVETLNLGVSDGALSEAAGEDGDLVFNKTGFQFVTPVNGLPVGAQIAGKPSNAAPANAIELQAIRTSDATGACEAAFIGDTGVELAMTCETPGSCAGTSGSVNGSAIATGSAGTPGSWTTLQLDFGDKNDSTAPIVFGYADAGSVRLHARKILTPSNEQMLGSSNTFVVRPFGFHLSVDQGSITASNPAATNGSGGAFEKAGLPFRVTATAVGWQSGDDADGDGVPDGHDDDDVTTLADLSNNGTLPNFATETVAADTLALGANLVLPASGNDPGLSGSTVISGFSNGAGSSSNVIWSEAGIIEITASLTDGSYQGASDVTARSGHVGRIVPHHFKTSVTHHGCSDDDGFSYSGQPLAEFTLTAYDSGGNVTKNHDGDSGLPQDIVVSEATGAPGSVINGGVSGLDFQDGAVTITPSPAGIGFSFANKETAPADVVFRAIDDDGVSSKDQVEGTTRIRSGRFVVNDASALVFAPAASALQVESYGTAGWNAETADECTTLDVAAFSLLNHAGNLAIGESVVDSADTIFSGGVGEAVLTAPGAGNDGAMELHYDADDWLEFDRDGNGSLDDPFGVIRFYNIYGTEPGFIYRQEVIQ